MGSSKSKAAKAAKAAKADAGATPAAPKAATDAGPGAPGASAVPFKAVVEADSAGATPVAAGAGAGAGAGAFAVNAFAVMRLTHDVERMHLENFENFAGAGFDAKAVELELETFGRLLRLHMRHEDLQLFNMLDDGFDGIATKEGLRDEHVEDTALFEAVVDSKGDAEAFSAAIGPYVAFEREHLEHEELVLMPRVKETADSELGRGAEIQKILMVDFDEYRDFMCAHVVGMLAKRAPYPKLRMYVSALQISTTWEQYDVLLPIVKASVVRFVCVNVASVALVLEA